MRELKREMVITDPVYGSFTITEPVLIELLSEPAVQRVRNVMQGGPTPIVCGWKDFSRLEHCIGAMLIVRTQGGSLEEQVAALLHDIPHTAFSHVVDVVFSKNDTQNYHEEIKEQIIRNSSIPEILKKHDFSLDRVLNDENFPILERPSPNLCADRVDYALRSYAYYYDRYVTSKDLFCHLTTLNDELVFDSIESAVSFGEIFVKLCHYCYGSIINMASYCVLADAVRHSLDTSVITEADLLLNDRQLWQLLQSSGDEYVTHRLTLIKPGFKASVVSEDEAYRYKVSTKKRWVRPKAWVEGIVYDSYAHEPSLVSKYNAYVQWVSQPYYVNIEGL
ncbi:MAG: HD domain-containing protein [bacterium]|nr:HD domain-containing protein [bacterium]